LEKEDLASVLVVDPTVMADGTNAGENRQESLLEFPPATMTATPAFVAASTAFLIAC